MAVQFPFKINNYQPYFSFSAFIFKFSVVFPCSEKTKTYCFLIRPFILEFNCSTYIYCLCISRECESKQSRLKQWCFAEMISKCLQKPQTLKNFLILITQTLNIPKNERKWNLLSWLMYLILSIALLHPAVQLPSVMTSKYVPVCHLSLHSLTAVTLLTANSIIWSF